MSKNFTIDTKQLKDLQKQISTMADGTKQLEAFFQDCAKALAARLLQRVIKRTPVEQNRSYKVLQGGSFKTYHIKGGALRRGWTGGSNTGADAWARSASVVKRGNVYEITVSNPVEYAPYVEYGHRQKPGRFVPAIGKRLKKSWVKGQFMLTLSTQEVERLTPALMSKMINEFLNRTFT